MEVIDRQGNVIAQLDRDADVQTSAQPTSIVVTPHPLTLEAQRIVSEPVREGESLLGLIERVAPEVNPQGWGITIDGHRVPAALWSRTYVKPGVIVECLRVVRGDVLKIAAIIALSYFTLGLGGLGAGGLFTAGGAIGGGFLAASAAFVVGTLLINQLLGPKQPSAATLKSSGTGTTYSLAGGTNQRRPYEPIGLLFGEVRIAPDFSSVPFPWFAGDDQMLYEVLHGGINCASVSDVRIGNTGLDYYTDWSTQPEGFSLMPYTPLIAWSNVDLVSGARLYGGYDTGDLSDPSPGAWVVRNTSPGTAVIEIDLEGSLYFTMDDGGIDPRSADIEADYRLMPFGDWMPLFYERYLGKSTDPIRVTLSLPVNEGQYQIRMRKNTADRTGREANTFSWTNLKSVQYDRGYYVGIGRFGLKIKATGQLNGTLDTVNWLARAKAMPIWDGTAWQVAQTRETGLSNPGAIMLQYARGFYGPDGKLQAGMGLSDDAIDIESFMGFMVRCAQVGFKFDWWLDQSMTHGEVLDNIAAAGMGSRAWPRGKLGVIWYSESEPITAVINMATMCKGSFKVDYLTLDTADGLEYQYFDRAQDFTWQTVRVTDPNVSVSLNPTKITSVGVTEEFQAAMLARFHMAQSVFQRKTITFETDLEHLTYQRGSVLALTHDVTQWGYGGRLGSVSMIGGSPVFELDYILPAGGAGYIGLRLLGERQFRIFQTQALEFPSRHIGLTAPWPEEVPLPGANGDMCHDAIWIYDFKTTPGYKVRVTSIQPKANMEGATVICVPEGPEFWDYVLRGTYTPGLNQSRLPGLPSVNRMEVTEQLSRQGNTFVVTITLTLDISGGLDHVDIWGSLADTVTKRLGTATGRRFSFTGGLDDVWTLEARPFNRLGQVGQGVSTTYAVVGLRYPPGNVPWFSIEGDTLTWGAVPDADLDGYVIRYHYGNNRSWGDAHPLHDGILTQSPYTPDATPQGPITLMICAIDTTGNLSDRPCVIQTQLGDVLVANVVQRFDFQADGFQGIISGAAVAGSSLIANSTATFYRADEADFYSQFDSAPFYVNNFSAMSYEAPLIAPTVVAYGSTMTLDVDLQGDAQFIEYRSDGMAPMFAVLDSEVFYKADDVPFYATNEVYQPWPGQITIGPLLYQFRFRAAQGVNQGRIATCAAVIDVPDVVERFNDVHIAAGGTRLVLSKTWYAIDNIQLTLQDDGGTAVQVKYLDKSVSLGPLVKCLDSAGNAVAGRIDAVLQGK